MPKPSLEQLYPGGKNGPNNEVLANVPGGQTWTSIIMLGAPDDTFQLSVPDIRMPANQYWPLHWHNCWIAVILLEGQCLIGDWWMQPGDVLVTDVGALEAGAQGAQLLEVARTARGIEPRFVTAGRSV